MHQRQLPRVHLALEAEVERVDVTLCVGKKDFGEGRLYGYLRLFKVI